MPSKGFAVKQINMISFIYFDVGGTLLDWSRVFEGAAKKFNLDPEDIGRVFDENHDDITRGIMSAKDLWNKCIQRYGLKNASEYDFLDSWVSDYEPIKEIHELISKVTPKYKIGLLSNIYKGMLPLLIEKRIIPNIQYEQIVFSCDVGMMKPNADIYALAKKRAKVNSNNILLVDDREDYLEGAKKAGWNIFLFNNKQINYSTKELEEYLNHY